MQGQPQPDVHSKPSTVKCLLLSIANWAGYLKTIALDRGYKWTGCVQVGLSSTSVETGDNCRISLMYIKNIPIKRKFAQKSDAESFLCNSILQ